MNVATIKYYDIANGPGVRVSLYVSGCRNRCKGCFNQETWDFDYGEPFTESTQEAVLNGLKPSYIKGFSLLGGDPFEPENQAALVGFMERLKAQYPDKTVWAYTGYDFERDLLTGKKGDADVTMRLLKCIDVLVDGRFVEGLKNPNLLFRGSSNQRIILVKQSLERDEVVRLVAFTDRLYIRAFNGCDGPALAEIVGDERAMEHNGGAMDGDRAAAFLRAAVAGDSAYAVEQRDTGRLVGCITNKPSGESCCELGMAFRGDVRGEGFEYEAANAVIDHIFNELGMFEVKTSADERDDYSLEIVRELGMKLTGSHKQDGRLRLEFSKNKGNRRKDKGEN